MEQFSCNSNNDDFWFFVMFDLEPVCEGIQRRIVFFSREPGHITDTPQFCISDLRDGLRQRLMLSGVSNAWRKSGVCSKLPGGLELFHVRYFCHYGHSTYGSDTGSRS